MRILVVASYAPSLLNFRGPLLVDLVNRGHSVSVAAPLLDESSSKTIRKLRGISVKPYSVSLQRAGLNFFLTLTA